VLYGKGLGGKQVLKIRWGRYYRKYYHRLQKQRYTFGNIKESNFFTRNRARRINRKLIALCCLALCGYVLHSVQAVTWPEIRDWLSEGFLRQSQRMYLAGLSYLEEDHADSLEDWLAEQAMRLIPFGGYVKERDSGTDTEDAETYAMILAKQANDENAVDADGNLIGTDDSAKTANSGAVIDTSVEKMRDFDYLLGNFYTVDSSTMIRSDELNGETLLGKDMHIQKSGEGPKVLIYHTHSQEMFADSVPGDPSTSIVGVGDYLTELLNNTYHIETLHHTGVYDLINGELDRSKAYDLAKPEIGKILEEHPSIEVVIDLHRDGVGEGTHLVTDVNGKPTAQIMFFNGLSKTRSNGEIDYLANPYIQDNLAFSLQMQVAAYKRYPGFARRIYLRGYRYNMHLMPKCLLVEAGAQTNTVQEMKNAMDVLAELLNVVLVE
jgi:stage II sporulation protein P